MDYGCCLLCWIPCIAITFRSITHPHMAALVSGSWASFALESLDHLGAGVFPVGTSLISGPLEALMF